MKIKYNKITKDLVAMGNMPNLSVDADEAIIELDVAIPSDISEYKVENGNLLEKTAKEKKDKKDKKDSEKVNKRNEKLAVLAKLKITEEELNILLVK